MLTKTSYSCEICGKTFKDAAKCEQHEKDHPQPYAVKPLKVTAGKIYPDNLHVSFRDGDGRESVARYAFREIVQIDAQGEG
ncbi:C2H2-type zinc finger protein [Anaeroselena agilis]|uniref:C2H2-type zinc finger protein n=1 Tax=Anaeroselena agilis TaxID=3063788 RepID=A0ABU3NZI5_9FIRM|nr:C2H2-type zinc finger protein [Selenomonadales bacterium 4137-cl]